MWRLEKRKVTIWKKDYKDSYKLAFIDMEARWRKEGCCFGQYDWGLMLFSGERKLQHDENGV
jgi:hypothetical protein